MTGASSVIMRAFHRLVVARPEARRFAARAWLGAPLVQASLATAGFRRTLRLITWFGSGSAPRRPVGPEEGASLVAGAFRLQLGKLGKGACLPQALLQYALHRRDGVPVRLVVGVRRPDDGRALSAHAWVEAEPRGERSPIARAARPARFTPLFVHCSGDQAS
jgi:hypothetical protein